jgi:hypothetical protein
MFPLLPEVDDGHSKFGKRDANEFASMAVLGLSLTAEQADVQILARSIEQAIDAFLKERALLNQRIDDMSIFIAGFVGRASAQRISHEKISNACQAQRLIQGRTRKLWFELGPGSRSNVDEVLNGLLAEQPDQLLKRPVPVSNGHD